MSLGTLGRELGVLNNQNIIWKESVGSTWECSFKSKFKGLLVDVDMWLGEGQREP